MCLDLMRALERTAHAREAMDRELALAAGGNAGYDAFAAPVRAGLGGGHDEADARRQAQALALALQASLLIRHAPAFVADAFCASRLAEGRRGLRDLAACR